ncbi:MAG TPA: NUDIX domain-containing protein [Bacteroidetes bacterium]|nr:NUDIX domain-containing protein [Bacteroidota bacterium]
MLIHHKLLEKTVDTDLVFDGTLLKVRKDRALLPNGGISTREWIQHPGACAVVPVFDNGDVMLVQQFRYGTKQVFIEVPAGKIDSGEAPDITATRELEEEVGLICDELIYLGHQYPAIGFSDEILHNYLALNLHEVPDKMDHDEFVEKLRVPFGQAMDWIFDGTINDAKSIIALIMAERKLR